MQSRRRSASYADRQWLQRSAYDNRKEIFNACQSLSCCFKRRSLTDDSASCRCWNPTDSLDRPAGGNDPDRQAVVGGVSLPTFSRAKFKISVLSDAESLAKEQVGRSSPHACAIKK